MLLIMISRRMKERKKRNRKRDRMRVSFRYISRVDVGWNIFVQSRHDSPPPPTTFIPPFQTDCLFIHRRRWSWLVLKYKSRQDGWMDYWPTICSTVFVNCQFSKKWQLGTLTFSSRLVVLIQGVLGICYWSDDRRWNPSF